VLRCVSRDSRRLSGAYKATKQRIVKVTYCTTKDTIIQTTQNDKVKLLTVNEDKQRTNITRK